jgi:hypothetical protein
MRVSVPPMILQKAVLQENKISSPNNVNQNENALNLGQSLIFSICLMDDNNNEMTKE